MIYTPTIGIGDLLTRPKALGLFTHVGVVVGPNAVLHNAPGKGEHLATFQEFSAGKPTKVHHTGANPFVVIARAQNSLGNPKKYDPILRNCEHTATEIVRGNANSPQLALFVIILTGCMLLIVSKQS
jgi:hypothetical protein